MYIYIYDHLGAKPYKKCDTEAHKKSSLKPNLFSLIYLYAHWSYLKYYCRV